VFAFSRAAPESVYGGPAARTIVSAPLPVAHSPALGGAGASAFAELIASRSEQWLSLLTTSAVVSTLIVAAAAPGTATASAPTRGRGVAAWRDVTRIATTDATFLRRVLLEPLGVERRTDADVFA